MLILRQILETVFNSGRCTSAGAGGLASAMFLFEIAMTHYYEKAVTIQTTVRKASYQSKSSNISRVNSPKHGSGTSNSTIGSTTNLSNSKVISLNDITNKFSSLSSAFGNFLGDDSQDPEIDEQKDQTIMNSEKTSETESLSSFTSSTPVTPSKVDIRYRNGVLKRVQLENINGDSSQTVQNSNVKYYRVYLYEGLILDWRKKLEQTVAQAQSNANLLFQKIPTFKFQKILLFQVFIF